MAIAVSAVTAWGLPESIRGEIRAVAAWDSFAIVALATTWLSILTIDAETLRVHARLEDPSRLASLILVVLGAGASLLAVLVLLQGSMTMTRGARDGAIALALSAVALAWLLIHTVFTLRYAHLYHDEREDTPPLEFPGPSRLPDYLDFAYVAFVIGMTAQTADVGVASPRLRRTVLLHGVIAFVFNTALVALSIGVLTSILSSPTTR